MDDIITKSAEIGGLSDIHIQSGLPLALRVNGSIQRDSTQIISAKDIDDFLKDKLSKENQEKLKVQKGLDLAMIIGSTRFRINVYSAYNGMNIVMRKIETKIPVFHEMGFPPVIESKLVTPLNGLILVTGPTGSGKSTSLAAMIDYINTNKDCNIITVEDPIEFVHEPKNSIITQRELGSNTPSFTDALRESLREDPDVILVGELRDQETISLALTAAETGHLVFGTLHTSGAPNTIHRIIDAFPPGQQDQIRAQIATSLKMVITQRLMKRADGTGRVAAFEILVSNNAVQNLIRENKIFQLPSTMQTGVSDGMVQMEKSIEELLTSGVINHDGIGH